VPSAETPRPDPEPTPPRPSKPGIPIDTELPWSDDKP
jgi:hypothetical protein